MWFKLIFLCVFSTQLINAQDIATFHLYTRNNPTTDIQLVPGSIQDAPIDVNKIFKFIIHGYTDAADRDWIRSMRDAFLKKGDYNVVVLDWKTLSQQLYDASARDTRKVGNYTADLLIDMKQTFGLDFKNVHLVGHSLGAHVSGFAAKKIINSNYEKIARITGMDPANPLFTDNALNDRLSVGDAAFIDVIHTDGYKFGFGTSIGDVDFYPNGGISLQPGCLTYAEPRVDLGPIVSCSHCRSYAYFTESINSNKFVGRQCGSYLRYIAGLCNSHPSAVMGENVDLATRGDFYLRTHAFSPYARG